MKTQRRILERARQGDPAAIATWLACCLHRRGLSATAAPEGDCLHLLLESAQVPDQQVAIATILHELSQLAPAFQALQVTGRQTGEAQPVWDCRLDLPAAVLLNPSRSGKAGTISTHPQRFLYTGMAAIAALIAVNVALGFRSILRLSGESREFADRAIPAIVEEWNADALIDRASPTLAEVVMPPEKLRQEFLQISRQLGAFQSAEPASCNLSPKFTREGKVTTSRCEAAIDFANSAIIIELDLVRQETGWQIDRFSVQPTSIVRW